MDQRIGQAQFEAPSPSDLFTPAVCTILVLYEAGDISYEAALNNALDPAGLRERMHGRPEN